ncbi:MAG: 6-pyruvoyl-tetrahydropterin synthase-related protein [cyanobacterium endosymbiont of Rhopalodia musculus]|uniref:6-pyruvoyl-tetrahydropterin synthase-related protein n=1 Tax=cyanobacterium endosymbiont of Epithemia clementina EcSB TaxID=3034674 RepID=UPI0024802FC0|nr:6-pyruvoyl-tetrahydropterin synthase-related protein [cyanobacterium endosymbiont of Epithemia clementina EcSB]WGT68319.1 6-pyruvoyl-tetrahydropterin synthase-related protein [cyanobacterium endosymbiont of Epithemia clementina EcSB]
MNFWKLHHIVTTFVQPYKTNLLILSLYGVIAIGLMGPMASSEVIFPYPDPQSHIGYIHQARLALEEGQFPLRVAPVENHGWRYPGFQFYSQVPYLVGALLYKFITPSNPYDAYKLVIWISFLVGAFYIYRLSLWLINSQTGAVLAGVSYISAPYFLNNIHARGAFTEAIAQGILPLVLYYTIQCYATGKRRYLLTSSLSWFLLATTHIITFIYTTLTIGILGFIVFLKTRKTGFKWSQLLPPMLAYGLGWLLAFYFLVPVVLLSDNLAVGKQVGGSNPFYSRWYTPLSTLISPTSLPPAPSETGFAPTYGLHPAVGWIFLAAWGVVIYYHYSSRRVPYKLQSTQPYLIGLLWIFLIALFATWSPIDFWKLLPRQLWVTQFTFRILTHVMWSGALLTGYAVVLIFRQRLDRRHLVIGILIIIIASRPWLPIPRSTATVADLIKEPLFRYSGALDYLHRAPITTLYGGAELRLLPLDWLPGYATWDVFVNRPLLLGAEFRYPLWQDNEKPILHLQGEVDIDNITGTASLEIQSDGRPFDTIPLTSRTLNWAIPVYKAPIPGEDLGLKFVFKGSTNDGQMLKIKVNRLSFEGMSPARMVIPVFVTQNSCFQKGISTLCEITLNQDAQIVQLPVLYYPQMLKVWVDDQLMQYFPVNHRDHNLVGLNLKPGTHKIRVTFHGLAWTNWISSLAWLGVILASITFLIQNKLKIKS